MNTLKIENFLIYTIALSLIVIYLADGLSKILLQLPDNDTLILPNRYVKALLVFLSLSCSCIMLKETYKIIPKIYLLLISLLLISVINWFLYGLSFNFLIKCSCFFFFSLLFFFKGEDGLWVNFADRTFKALVYINFFLIILGILFDFQIFKTYFTRFGYNGLLLTPMQSTYFYLSAIVIALSRKDPLFFIVSILCALLAGTKILLLFLILLGGWLIFTKIKGLQLKMALSVFIMLVFSVVFLLFFKQDLFKEVIQNDGLLSAVFSFRDKALISLWHNSQWLDYNLITGGISLSQHKVESDLIDVCLYFGALGIIIYLLFFMLLKNYFLTTNLAAFYFTIVLFFMTIAGNFLFYPINCFLFLFTLKSLSITTNNKHSIFMGFTKRRRLQKDRYA